VIKITRSKSVTKDRFIELLIMGTNVNVPQKSWAHGQLNNLIKYHNMSNGKLAEKAKVPIEIARKFKEMWKDGYRLNG
jgi:hypothetical protein